jgi:hypothetical protein
LKYILKNIIADIESNSFYRLNIIKVNIVKTYIHLNIQIKSNTEKFMLTRLVTNFKIIKSIDVKYFKYHLFINDLF